METKWAEENLQTIRTLMERSAIYRRALAPIMIFVGAVGIIGGFLGWRLQIDSARGFVSFWSSVAVFALTGAFLIVRRQAIKDQEKFWSPPTRRVAHAMLPSMMAGLVLGIVFSYTRIGGIMNFTILLPFFWGLFYGCALHAAGLFMPRGVKWLGWFFIALPSLIWFLLFSTESDFDLSGHCLMGGIFGGLHLAYGTYLYFTEKKNPVA